MEEILRLVHRKFQSLLREIKDLNKQRHLKMFQDLSLLKWQYS